jgi:large subunit ribosomal protein L15
MDLSNLKPAEGSKHSKKRIGRGQGSGQGVQAGRGHKGAKSRSGFKFKRGFEGGQMPLHRRIPKRGFHNLFRTEYVVVNLDTLAERFEDGTTITPEMLIEHGLIHSVRRPLKVLARGDISKKLTVHAHKFSGKAAEKIAAAGGAAEVLASAKREDSATPAASVKQRAAARKAAAK